MRVLQSGKGKRREVKVIILTALLFFLLIPYLGSLFAGGEYRQTTVSQVSSDTWVEVDRLWGTERIPLEEYLVGMMAATVPLDYHKEVLKAQAIMLRSWCMSLATKGNGYDIVSSAELEETYLSPKDCKRIWGQEYEEKLNFIKEILEETGGMVLVGKGQIISPPFFRISSGRTRRVEEYQARYEEWEYLLSVDCPQDVEAEEYLSRVEVKETDFYRKVGNLLGDDQWSMDKIILYRDTADYVKTVQIGDRQIQGEDFRYELGLASSCFTLDKQGDKIIIKTRGIGHGFGFNQYYANILANQGQAYRQLLETFFSGLRIEKM